MNDNSHTDFDRFLEYGNNKAVPQILCGIFCRVLKSDVSAYSFQTITCFDKPFHTLKSFDELLMDNSLNDKQWDVVFLTILLGKNNQIASAIETNKRMDSMLDSIRAGSIESFVIFDRNAIHIQY